MRRLLVFLGVVGFLLAGVFACFEPGVAAARPVAVNVDGQQVDCPDGTAYLDRETNRVYVPLRFISQALGFKTSWDADRAVVNIDGGGDAVGETDGAATNDFAFDLLGELYTPGENMFASPASVYLALAVLCNGASDETRAALDGVLGARNLDAEAFNRKCAALREALAAPDERVTLNIADGLWLQKGTDFQAEFLHLARKYHGAEISTLDFSDPGAPAVINSWISKATNDMIREMVDQIDPWTVLMLANAIYFHGDWTAEFDPERTQPRDFTKADGSRTEVQMMHQNGMFPYLKGEDFAAVRLGYGDNERLGMYLFVPDREADPDEFMARLNAGLWENWTKAFSVREGMVGLPRFKMEYGVDLEGPLTALGLGVLFDARQANFSRMAPGGDEFYVGEARHKAVVEVDEKGTEAAAVTTIGVRATSACLDGPFTLIADRPFFFVIHDDETDTVLFAGMLHDPQ